MGTKILDRQLSGMAGEFLTVGKLFKLGCQASVTMGNAKSIDVLAYNPRNEKSYCVQVKTLRHYNCFPMKRESIIEEHIYVFIILNKFEQQEEYYILSGKVIKQDNDRFFGSSYKEPNKASKMPAINYGPLRKYKDNWQIFDL